MYQNSFSNWEAIITSNENKFIQSQNGHKHEEFQEDYRHPLLISQHNSMSKLL